ncbi:MAG: hypothetical protein R3C56_01040 [Pirellulaceae bacterium]
MTNRVAVRLHCGRGDEFLCEADCHVYSAVEYCTCR